MQCGAWCVCVKYLLIHLSHASLLCADRERENRLLLLAHTHTHSISHHTQNKRSCSFWGLLIGALNYFISWVCMCRAFFLVCVFIIIFFPSTSPHILHYMVTVADYTHNVVSISSMFALHIHQCISRLIPGIVRFISFFFLIVVIPFVRSLRTSHFMVLCLFLLIHISTSAHTHTLSLSQMH